MFFRKISYFKFLLESTNQHGVHSPFVFDFVTKGLYHKKIINNIPEKYPALKSLTKKEERVLSKIIHYFNISTIHFDLVSLNKNLNNKYKLLYIKLSKELILDELKKLNSKHFVVVHGIYKDKKTKLKWLEIIKKTEDIVTIDLFYFGIIFFRKEQAKEHFNIRV
jgi:hypothetical protein